MYDHKSFLLGRVALGKILGGIGTDNSESKYKTEAALSFGAFGCHCCVMSALYMYICLYYIHGSP